ncbi:MULTISPECIES: xylulokinase [unclassified Microbacterium]|uniref:xylulokinase n=1 Tax=unclassified Microbacterium TaxID=2609290 RepID=UPI000EAA6EF6|nr:MULTISPECIES: xylulokinase [unclassified Microbacterium]MBT2483643.1 xylulokinase [Microbacterium sp. ISL-108]RKN66645.1 xylulokinase [Microbacterium sp. CGR2]
MALVLGVDSSTQSCKVIVADAATGAVVRTGRAPHPDGTSVDPEAWWHALKAAIADAGGLDDIEAWAIGGQQHGMVALDAEGRVIRDALLWNDTRSADAASDLVVEFGAETLVQRSGLVPVASFTISKVRWLRDHEPENAARVAAVALPHDWLTWRLRGFGPVGADGASRGPILDELVTDRSDASGTGYWNPATGEYDRDLLTAALGHDAVLPRVLGADESVTDDAGRRVAPGAGDNAAAALGLGAGPGDVVVSIGTSGTVFAVSETPSADASGIIAGFASADGHFLPLVCTLNAARVLDVTAALLGVDHAELSRLALAAPAGAAGLALVPYFEGERTPNLPDATATLSGMTLASTTRENLARAAVEGMLSGLGAGLDALRESGVPLRRALLIGGGAQSPAVRTIAPEVFGIPVEVPAAEEYVALGAARQAASVLSD